jgi:UPF0271 protein
MVDRVNICADMGESFGIYRIGDDASILKVVRTANIACGFHGGDPTVMRQTVAAAEAGGVSIGAHPGFNDLWGFGRRRIDMDPGDLEYAVAYQIGALQGIASYTGIDVSHVKPHGSLNNMAAEDFDVALAVGKAIKAVDPGLIYLALSGSEMVRAGEQLGLPVAHEAFADRLYDDDGMLTSRKLPGAVIHDAGVAARRVVEMVGNQEIVSRNGKHIPQRIDSICVHGDEPTAVALAQSVRDGLEAAGIRIVPLPEMDIV